MKTIKQLLTTIAVLLCSVVAHAYDFVADGIYYNIISEENSTVNVTNRGYGDNYSGDIVIPEKVVYKEKTYSVIAIAIDAFRECNNLTSVKIPNSVTAIGESAFRYCR